MKAFTWSWFTVLKYAVYAVLVVNLFLFIREDYGSFQQMGSGVVSFAGLLGIFAQTVDTAAWVILLLLFELETAVIDDDHLTRRVERILHTVRFICAGMIVYALYGYLHKAMGLADFVALDVTSACALGEGYTAMVRLDGYETILPDNCGAFLGALLGLPGTTVVATSTDLTMATRLAWLDVINASAWIVIIAMLEVDVRITEHHRHARWWSVLSRWLKALLYAVLFIAAVLWGLAGTWLDFVDASLWLVAFFCIELNVFAWARELAPRKVVTASATAG